jgi:hypothetical protein
MPKKYYINFDSGKQVTIFDTDKLVFFNSHMITGGDMRGLRNDMEGSEDGFIFINLNKVNMINVIEENDGPDFLK